MSSSYFDRSLAAHEASQGKWGTCSRMPLETQDDLALAYTPGVAEPCRFIAEHPEAAYTHTMKGRTVAIISDGTSVLGLGNIGPMAGLPVMEGKAVLYKKYADIDAVPLVLGTTDVEKIVETVVALSPTFGGIHLEDIAAPACFAIERALQERLTIPVMHDDQHATAIVTLAALYNALRVVGKRIEDVRVVVNGSGAAGTAIAYLLQAAGAREVRVLDSKGILALGREGMNAEKDILAQATNPQGIRGTLADALVGSDVVVGVSKAGVISQDMVRSMASQAIVFGLANPVPEIMPSEAHEAGASVVATGRSDFPNQVNNVLVYPGLFSGLLAARLQKLTEEVKIVVAQALASTVPNPTADRILPSILEYNPAPTLREALLAYVKEHPSL